MMSRMVIAEKMVDTGLRQTASFSASRVLNKEGSWATLVSQFLSLRGYLAYRTLDKRT